MGRQLGVDSESMYKLGLAGLFMDNGKLPLPDSLWRKSSSLSEADQLETHRHIELGLMAFKNTGLPDEVLQGIQSHHERFDGSGYPNQLNGVDIPLYARIADIVDCCDPTGMTDLLEGKSNPGPARRV